jgi:hypothetical protein
MMEVVGTLLAIAAGHIVLSTPNGRKKIPYKNISVSYGGMVLRELLRKKAKVIIWEDGVQIEISSPKD